MDTATTACNLDLIGVARSESFASLPALLKDDTGVCIGEGEDVLIDEAGAASAGTVVSAAEVVIWMVAGAASATNASVEVSFLLLLTLTWYRL